MTEQYLYHLWMHVPIHHMCASHMSEIVPAKAREASQSEFLLEGMRQIGHVSWSFTINSVELAASGRDSLGIYLPNPESELSRRLIIGSAIVGVPSTDGTVLIYYEGNRFDLPELRSYRQRVERAAMRLRFNEPHGYPTRARDLVDPRELELIGTLDSTGLTISHPAGELAWWISEADLIELGLISTTTS